MIVALLAFISRATALIEAPSANRCNVSSRDPSQRTTARAFRCMKTVDLELRPVFPWTAARVRAHVLLCMLAYYLEWHMRQKLAPLLFDDHDRPAAEAQRTSPVAKAEPSPASTPQGRQ